MTGMSDDLRDKVRRYLCDVPMDSPRYVKLKGEIVEMCGTEGLGIQDVLNEVALEWRLVERVMDD